MATETVNVDATALRADATSKANSAQAAAIAAASSDATTKANAAQAFAIQRANHTGTQLASTISDFDTAALAAAPAETTTTTGALINGATAKTTPVDADFVGLMDSAASNILKKLSWANIKATLKAYFDAIYEPLYDPVFMTYTGGSQVNNTTTYADVDASAVLPVPAAGLYEVVIRIVHDTSSTATGAGFSLNGPAFNFMSTVVNYDTLLTNRASYTQITYDWGLVAPSSRGATGNYASITAHIRFTASGTLALRFRSEVGGSAITVTGVSGFIKRIE